MPAVPFNRNVGMAPGSQIGSPYGAPTGGMIGGAPIQARTPEDEIKRILMQGGPSAAAMKAQLLGADRQMSDAMRMKATSGIGAAGKGLFGLSAILNKAGASQGLNDAMQQEQQLKLAQYQQGRSDKAAAQQTALDKEQRERGYDVEDASRLFGQRQQLAQEARQGAMNLARFNRQPKPMSPLMQQMLGQSSEVPLAANPAAVQQGAGGIPETGPILSDAEQASYTAGPTADASSQINPRLDFAAGMPQQAEQPPPQQGGSGTISLGGLGSVGIDKARELASIADASGDAKAAKFINEKVARSVAGDFKTPKDRIKTEQIFRKEYMNAAKPQFDRLNSYQTIMANKTDAKSQNAPAQMAMVFNFMKMLDPGSVVRESEYAAAARARGVADSAVNLIEKIQSGQVLTGDQVDKFLGVAKKYAQTAHKNFNNIMRGY